MASSIYRKTALLLWADLTDRQGCDIDVDAITEAEIIATWEQILERASSAQAVVQRQCEYRPLEDSENQYRLTCQPDHVIWFDDIDEELDEKPFCPYCGGLIKRIGAERTKISGNAAEGIRKMVRAEIISELTKLVNVGTRTSFLTMAETEMVCHAIVLLEKDGAALPASSSVQRKFSEAEMREAFEAGCLITNMTKMVAQAEREFAVWMQKRFPKVKVIVR